ncbi:MAG: hypothetical protein ACRD2A_09250 [Vicinamibacterales bacterium]
MESHTGRWLPRLLIVLVLLAPALGAVQAKAEDGDIGPPVDIWVGTDDDGVNVDAGTGGQTPGSGGGGGTGGSSSEGPKCWLEELKQDQWDDSIELEYWARRMRYAPYNLVCDGVWKAVVWIEIILDEAGNPLPPPTDPREVAERLRDQMPVPRSSVAINPDRGVVGVESWFWIDGYDGSTLRNSTDAFGSLVEVEARVTRYRWSFGDGTTVESDTPGRAYPERSQVRHVYERSSAGLPAGYSVEATFTFAVRYRVDGGAWIELPGISRTANASHPVRESQAVIQR